MKPILITGCARTGTSLLVLLMKGFASLDVHADQEINPVNFQPDYQPNRPRPVIKYPQGAQDPATDYGVLTAWPDPACHYLKYYLDDWQVLICLRDARDILVSKHQKNPEEYYVSPERCYGALSRDLEALKHPNTLAVYYEKLVANPRQVMAEIAGFIGENYDYATINDFYTKADPDNQIGMALNSLRPIDQASVGKWRLPEHEQRIKDITPYYLERIEPLMKQLGY